MAGGLVALTVIMVLLVVIGAVAAFVYREKIVEILTGEDGADLKSSEDDNYVMFESVDEPLFESSSARTLPPRPPHETSEVSPMGMRA